MKWLDPISARKPICVLSSQDLRYRLMVLVVTKIRNGEFTERRLARMVGVSQPQLHKVLKGVRSLKHRFRQLPDAAIRKWNFRSGGSCRNGATPGSPDGVADVPKARRAREQHSSAPQNHWAGAERASRTRKPRRVTAGPAAP